MKDFISIADFSTQQLRVLLERALADKKLFAAGQLPARCQGKTLALIFEKPSLRTRVSFEAAITQLGGGAIYLSDQDIGLGKREAVKDVARVLGRMCDAIAARTFSHEAVVELARHSACPVINALTDYSHPCQAMADILTAKEALGRLHGRTLAFIGDGNNVARSLATLCVKLGMHFVLACPEGFELEPDFVAALAEAGEGSYRQTNQPLQAVEQASIIYTDTWVSMGQDAEKADRQAAFQAFQVNADLLAAAPRDAIVMHCLPAYRGCEITDEVMEAHAQTIFAEAENRLHFQRSLLNVLMCEGGIP